MEVGAHQGAGGTGVAGADGFIDGGVFNENMVEAVAGAPEREAVEAHADGDVFFERLHGGDEVGVERGLRNAEVEHEIGIGAVSLSIGGVAQKV